VGDIRGRIFLVRNVGTKTEPEYGPELHLNAGGKPILVPCGDAGPHAADWDGDGDLDVLVGDIATMKPDLPEPTAEEKKAQDAARAEMETLQAKYQQLVDKVLGANRVKDPAEREKVQKELRELQNKMQALRAKVPPEYENHGWVWYFERRPAEG